MVLIQTDEYDSHTYAIVDYLKHKKVDFLIINQNSKLVFQNLIQDNNIVDFEILINERKIKLSQISAFWFRRYSIFFDNMELLRSSAINKYHDIKNHFKVEISGLIEFVDYLLENSRKVIGNYSVRKLNKLIGIEKAKKAGFKVPYSLIDTNIDNIAININNGKNIVSKSIENQLSIETGKEIYKLYTEKINVGNKQIGSFFPTLFQYQVDKKIELRVFYLLGKCYTMAIFSQNDNQTEVDFRRYNRIKPNRYVPYKLPNNIENRIELFMDSINLNTGSLDIILDKMNEYVFLEVNPVGMFGMVSFPCNYKLEELIAKELINE